jgi:hypothetical protein
MEYISLGSNCSLTYQFNKYGLRTQAYPFDWAKINTLTQLLNVLENDFDDFSESLELKKISSVHVRFDSDTNTNTELDSSSLVLTNKYQIEFAHELSAIYNYNIEEFKTILDRRINRFTNLLKNRSIDNKLVTFVRIELTKIKSTWVIQVKQLISVLEKKYINKFKLILIICSNLIFEDFPDFVHVIRFNAFSPDWKMDHLEWKNILSN